MRGYPEHLHEVINEDLQESIYDETLEEDKYRRIEMKKKAMVKATVIATVYIHEDILGNQEIEDFEDILETYEFEVIEEIS